MFLRGQMNTRNHLLLAALWLLAALPGSAQQKALTLEDAILRAGRYYPERAAALQWIPGTDRYSHVKGTALMRGTTGNAADQQVLTLADLNKALAGRDTLSSLPAMEWANGNTLLLSCGPRLYAYAVNARTATLQYELPGNAGNTDRAPTNDRVAYTGGNDLFIAGPGTAVKQVTHDGADGIVNGKSVHREEYGVEKGTFWSPDGGRLAFYRMDETMVTPYYIEDIGSTPSTFEKFRYPMAGQTSHQVKLGVYDLRADTTVFIVPEGPPDHYLTNISWEPDGRHLCLILLNRATDHFKVIRYDASTGKAVRTLFEERNEKWLEPQHPLTFLKRTPGRYIHWSQRDGWWHLYLYDVDKGLLRQLTDGPREMKRIIGMDATERYLYVEGTGIVDPADPRGAMDTHLYRMELATGAMQQITLGHGTHRGQLSSGGHYLIDQWSSMEVPGRTQVLDATNGRTVKTIINSADPLAQVQHGRIELLQVEGVDGAKLNARLIKPSTFSPGRKYPVLVYTYNGPHVQLVTNSFLGGAQLWMLEAAERGFLVFTVDGHGSGNRGRAFEQVIYRQLGITEVKDQLLAAQWLKRQPFVDSTRMAIHGWSFGGHVTVAALLRSPGTFKAGVAGGAVQDWHLYEVMYTERYMDTPAENPEGYAATALPPAAGELRDHLLLIHDNMDNVVVPEHALRFLKSCVDKGVQPDFFYYPGHGHNVRGKDRVHLYTRVLDYISEKLGVTPLPMATPPAAAPGQGQAR